MALLDSLKNLIPQDTNIFGARTPSYLSGIVSDTELEKAKQQSLFQGLLGTAVGYLAQPKNQGYGSALPYLAKGYLQGMQSANAPYAGLEKDILMKQKFDEIKRAETQRKDLEQLRGQIYSPTTVTEDVLTNQYQPIVGTGTDGTTQIAPNMNFVQQAKQETSQVPSYNEAAMNELQFKFPEVYGQIIQNKKTQAEVAKLEAEAAAKGGTDLNISKLNPKDFTQESWTAYATPNSPYYGDTRILDGQTPEVQAKINEMNAKMQWEYGVTNPYNNSVDSGGGYVPADSQTTSEKKKQGRNQSTVILPFSNEEVIPRIIDPTTPGKDRQALKGNQAKARTSLSAGVSTMRQERKKIRDLINSGDLPRITGAIGGNTPNILPGAKDAQAKLDTIKNLEFLNNYTTVKATGGGFGSLTEKEGERLETIRQNLNTAQSTQEVEKNLRELDNLLARAEKRDYEAYMAEYGEYNYQPLELPEFSRSYLDTAEPTDVGITKQTDTMNQADAFLKEEGII
jgi:hypothetical protein